MSTDEIGQEGNGRRVGDTEPIAQKDPERDAQLGTGLRQTQEDVTSITTGVALGAAADLALDHLTAQVTLRAVGVQRDLRPVEHSKQLGLVRLQPSQGPVQEVEAGRAAEEPVTPRLQAGRGAGARVEAIGFEIAVQPPDQQAYPIDFGPLPGGGTD